MPNMQLETDGIDVEAETSRWPLWRRPAFWIPTRASYDAITRLCAEYFQADNAVLEFGDEGRSGSSLLRPIHQGIAPPNSVFDMVLAENGPVVIQDASSDHGWPAHSFFSSVPGHLYAGVPYAPPITAFSGRC